MSMVLSIQDNLPPIHVLSVYYNLTVQMSWSPHMGAEVRGTHIHHLAPCLTEMCVQGPHTKHCQWIQTPLTPMACSLS